MVEPDNAGIRTEHRRDARRAHGGAVDVRDGRGRRLRHAAAGVEARARVVARHPRSEPRRGTTPRSSCTRTRRSRSRSTSARPRTWRRSSSSGTAWRRATGSRSSMRNFPEWSIAFWAAAAAGAIVVPLNAWWTRRRARVRPARLGRQGPVRRRRAARRASPTCFPRSTPRRSSSASDATAHPGVEAVGRRRSARFPADAELPDGRARTRGPRDDLLHVGHDRPARRARSARTATSAATSSRSRSRGAARADARRQGAAGDAGSERVPALRAVLPRHRLPLGARRQRRRRRQARADAQVGRGTRAGAHRARAGHDLRRRAGDGVAGAAVAVVRDRATSRACSRSATAARRPRPSSCAGSSSCSPVARRRTATG